MIWTNRLKMTKKDEWTQDMDYQTVLDKGNDSRYGLTDNDAMTNGARNYQTMLAQENDKID